MKKNRVFCVILALLMLICICPMSILALQTDASVTNGCNTVDASMTLSTEGKLTDTAQAAILYELNSQTMIYAYNPDGRIYPTSMVKMMTALVAIENAPLTDEVTVTRSALDSVAIGSVSAGLKAGETLTLGDLLYCMMVGSANDASAVIAEYIAGNQSAFIQMMNDKAVQLGCRETAYTNVHGLHDEGTYTTARDLCRITEAALENETFKMLFTTARYTIPATNKSPERTIHTTNYMMKDSTNKKYPDERVTGGKTGATDQGGRCLVQTAEYGGMELLCIVMGAKPTIAEDGSLSAFGSFEESKILIDYAFDNFQYRQVFFEGQTIAQYPVEGGANHVVTKPTESASTVLPIALDDSLLRWVYQRTSDTIKAPVELGQTMGIVQAWYGEKCLAQTEMVAMHAVAAEAAPVVPQRPAGMGGNGNWNVFLMIAGAIVGLLLIAVVALFAVRYSRILMRVLRRRAARKRRRS